MLPVVRSPPRPGRLFVIQIDPALLTRRGQETELLGLEHFPGKLQLVDVRRRQSHRRTQLRHRQESQHNQRAQLALDLKAFQHGKPLEQCLTLLDWTCIYPISDKSLDKLLKRLGK